MTAREEDTLAPLPAEGEVRLPDPPSDEDAPADDLPAERSLLDDIGALFDDAKTYFQAELTYQKTRASFVSNRLKKTVGFAFAALFLVLLATVGLTVGLIIALSPLLTPWGATAVVVLGLLLLAYLLVRSAGNAWSEIMGAVHEGDPDAPQEPDDHG